MIEAKIRDLQIQPIKGGCPLKLDEVRMTKAGLETVDGMVKDHFLVAVTETLDDLGYHNFLSQRVQIDPKKNMFVSGTPHLALIQPETRNGHLVLNFNGQSGVEDPGESNDNLINIIPVQVWEYRGEAIEVPIFSEWLSDNLKRKVKVARTSGPWNRLSRQNFMENDSPLRAQDGYPVHAISWEDATAIFEALKSEVDPNRFRYQVLLEGLEFRNIHNFARGVINGVRVEQPKPCDRCEVTGIDQEKGEFSKIKPLSGLFKLGAGRWIRPDNGQKVQIMGENWLPQDEVIIKIDDKVEFTDLKEIPLSFEGVRKQ
ncbi:MAG: MOSC domain-containing protein [Candidatus Daviesbacteria bacterium]|nr:MOSC domain-containing protein [Candidatus Daviesbacteria bacterium]